MNSIGIDIGRLYAINTLGAIVGTVSAGFLLIPILGIQSTVKVAILVNLAIGAAIADRGDDRYYDRRFYDNRRYVRVNGHRDYYYYYAGNPNRYYRDRYYSRYYQPYYRERYSRDYGNRWDRGYNRVDRYYGRDHYRGDRYRGDRYRDRDYRRDWRR